MTAKSTAKRPPQYTPAFLAGSFGLTQAQAQTILESSGVDRLKAAEMARVQKTINN
jgi:hypothetical protein